MKKILTLVVILLFTIIYLTCMTTAVFAQSSKTLISEPIEEPAIDIQTVINNKVTKEYVEEIYGMGGSFEKPEKYTYDPSVYLLEYSVSTDYWNTVTSLDYAGITEKITYTHPTIYIPIFADIENTEGEVSNRNIGYIKLRYDAIDKDYRRSMAIYNLPDEYFKNKKQAGFYEQIADYLSESDIRAAQVFLIRYPSSLSDSQEKIAVIKTKNDTVIYDFSNSCHLNDNDEYIKAIPYSVEEYRSLRMEAEKSIYQTVDDWKNVLSGGNTSIISTNESNWYSFWPYVIIGGITFIMIIIAIIKKQKKAN